MKISTCKIIAVIVTILLILSVYSVSLAEPYTVTVTVEPENGGTVTGDGTFENQNTVLVATPAAGYVFVGWFRPDEDEPITIDGEVVGEEFEFDYESDRTYIAKFEQKIQVGVIADPAVGGLVEQTGDGNYALGDTITVTATANEGYRFIGWFDNASPVEPLEENASYTFKVEAPISLVAKFLPQYNLTLDVSPKEGGTTAGAGTYDGGSIVTAEAIPEKDYSFAGWVSSDAPGTVISTDEKYTTNLDTDLSLTATFKRSAGFIFSRIMIVLLIVAGGGFAAFVVIRRTQVIQKRKNYRRPQNKDNQRRNG